MTVKNIHGLQAIDSREVAEKVEKKHAHLLRDIAGYIKIMESATESIIGFSGTERKIAPSEFFIPSTYKDSTGRELPCYLITKKGCDMIANKLTGEKGVSSWDVKPLSPPEKLGTPATGPSNPSSLTTRGWGGWRA